MGLNDFIVNARIGTFDKLVAKQSMLLGNQAVIANQGSTYYVDSGSGSSTNTGKTWSQALATLDQAINKCTANQGDTIVIAEGHSESYTTTGAKAIFDTAGINVIGLGSGSDRPTFSFGHVGATWTISAANTRLANLLFVTAIDSVVTYGTISAADCTMINCESRDAADKEVLDGWTVSTLANRLKVENYKHVGYIGGNANDSIFQLTGVDDFEFKKCLFLTQSGTTAGSGVIELASECLRGLIADCDFYVDGKSDFSDNIVDTDGTSTVIVKNCFDLEVKSKFSGGGNGSSFSLAGDDVSSIIDSLYGTNGIASFPAAAAPANDVSLAEVLRDIWNIVKNGTAGSNYIAVTADLSSETWNTQATHKLFGVTGLVRMKIIAEVTTTGDDSSGNTSTIQLGTANTTNAFIAATEVDDLAAGELWYDATPTTTQDDTSNVELDKTVNDEDVGYEIAGEAAIDGEIVFHCLWEARNSTGAVVAGDGSAMV